MMAKLPMCSLGNKVSLIEVVMGLYPKWIQSIVDCIFMVVAHRFIVVILLHLRASDSFLVVVQVLIFYERGQEELGKMHKLSFLCDDAY